MLQRSAFLAILGFLLNNNGVLAEAVFNADQACALNLTKSQGKHYGKTNFMMHSRVAEIVGNLLADFYDADGVWTISPEDLQDIVLSNIHAVEGTMIYGSAIAFEPNVWNQTTGLSEGVPYPAASEACLHISEVYCELVRNETTGDMVLPVSRVGDYRLDHLTTTLGGETLYCPYAYHGPPEEIAYANCSKAAPEYCPTMDISYTYDYSDIANPDVEWYTAPRCLFFRDGITDGYWTSPYFDAGAGNINMVTFSQPIVYEDKFLGIATIDIEVEALCYGNQCEDQCPAEDYRYNISECINDERIITYTSDDPSCPINPNAVHSLSCSYVPVSSTIGIVCTTLASLGAAICLAIILTLIVKRESRLIKASQVKISCGFVAGAFLANVGIYALVGELTTVRCKGLFWALILPMTILLAFLFGKVYRAYKVFMAAKRFRRLTITDTALLFKIFLVILVQIVILLVWTFVEDSHIGYTKMVESVDYRYCTEDYCFPTETQCIQNYNIVGIFSYVYIALILVIGCVLSYQSRKLPNCLHEAKYIMFAMYNIALFAILIGMVAAVAGDELSASVRTLLLSFAIFFTATGSVLLVFLPKFLKMWKTPEQDLMRQLRTSVAQDNGVTSLHARMVSRVSLQDDQPRREAFYSSGDATTIQEAEGLAESGHSSATTDVVTSPAEGQGDIESDEKGSD